MTNIIMAEKNHLSDIANKLQGVIETAIDGIITIDDRGLIETINKAALTQFGYRADEVVGHNIKILMPDPYRAEHDGYLHRYNTTRKPKIIGIGREVIGLKKNGDLFPFRLAVSEVILNDRVIFTGIIHDLTDIKKAENDLILLNEALEKKVEERTIELEDAINKLLYTNKALEDNKVELKQALVKEKELNELKSRFVSMASHEFRTPLSTILSSATLISRYTEETQNEKRQKHVNRIKSAVNNLTGILNDFLSLSKIEEGKIEVSKGEVILSELIDTVLDEVKGLLKPNQHITKECSDELTLITDHRILKNILFNLISNAIKYSGEHGQIHCIASIDKHNLLIQVSDNGMGIPLNDQKHLFTRFFRASNVENIQGTGLGLNIVQRYVNLLEGEITFESTPGSGTTFEVRVPIK